LIDMVWILDARPAAQDFTFSTGEELRADVARVPCESSRRMTEAKELFRRMGAAESEISIDQYKGVENVTVRKQGDGPGVIVLGAHYDKVSQGCGALDNSQPPGCRAPRPLKTSDAILGLPGY
jgi:hypothetical protein